jgi:hypothetical protein
VSKSRINQFWHKLWSDYNPVLQEHDTTFASITENVTEIAKKIEQDAAVVSDINEHFESHDEELLMQD